jgi:subtilisin family serine protease
MKIYLKPSLGLIYNQLSTFAALDNFWNLFDTAFGTQYDHTVALTLRTQWLSGDFSQIPQIEILDSTILGIAKGAYAARSNKIYLSSDFIATSTPEVISAVLIEEIGHFIDAQINQTDTLGDEGEIFSDLVNGRELSVAELQRLKAEDDSAVIALNGETIAVEQATVGVNPAFDLIGLTQLRNDSRFTGIDGSGFAVAVIDSGLDSTHSLLNDNYVAGYDFFNRDDNPEDTLSHGTHVAGTVGAEDPNIGVAPQVDLIGLKIGDEKGPSITATEAALQWVIANKDRYKIVAVNMSLGSGFYTSASQAVGDIRLDEVRRLEELGVVVVSSAGNDFKGGGESQNVGGPAIFSTLSVGAVWEDGVDRDRITSFSQRLVASNTIFAPGAFIISTVPGNGFERKGGTSMASPIVAGAVALMQEAAMQFGGRLLSPSEVSSIMRSTSDIIFDGDYENDNVRNTNTSYPRLNIYKAVQEIQRRFQQAAPSGDPNGTIQGAYLGPILDGTAAINPILGSIGTDGVSTNVGNKDVDIIKFELRSSGTVTIQLGSNSSNPADFNTLLRLFNTSGQELAFNDNVGSGQFSGITSDLSAGTYYVGVSGYNNRNYNPNVAASGVAAATGNYSLQFQLSNSDPNGIVSGAAPVNFGTDLAPLKFNGILGSDPITNSDQRITTGAADVDMFKVVAPDNGILLIDIDTPYNDGFVDSYLRVFDENGNQVFSNDDSLSINNSGNYTEFTDSRYPDLVFQDPSDRSSFYGHTSDSFTGLRVERGKTYYISVSDYHNDSYDPNSLSGRSASGTGGLYDLIVQFFNNDQNGSITQALDSSVRPLPSTRSPGVIGGDSNFTTGEFIEVGDRDIDFIKVNSPTAGILEIDIDSYDDSSIANKVNTTVFIFDGQGKLLASNDDNDKSLDPLLLYEITANRDYFVAVAGYGNNSFDPFQLGSGSSGGIGEYKFSSRLLPLSEANSLFNNTSSSGTVENISIGSTTFGKIGDDNGFVIGADDIDIYRFTPSTSGAVIIQTQTNEPFSADTFLRIFNTNGTEIAFNDDENNLTRGSAVQLSVTAGTQYLIGVNGASPQARNYNPLTGAGAANGSQGSYSLSIQPSITQGVALTNLKQNPALYMDRIRDYDGNNLGSSSSWKLLGDVDVQGDGDSESVFVNPLIGRWATVGTVNDLVDFSKHGQGGDTRVVGIYIDPTLKNQPQNIGGPFDSQRRFQNDLRIDNLNLLAAADYNKDGFQDMYFKLGDGTAVLRALMHLDGNIQYANYQSKADLTTFMTANNVSSSIWGGWL